MESYKVELLIVGTLQEEKEKKNIGKTWKSKICEMGNSRWPSVLKDTKDWDMTWIFLRNFSVIF